MPDEFFQLLARGVSGNLNVVGDGIRYRRLYAEVTADDYPDGREADTTRAASLNRSFEIHPPIAG